MLLSETAAAVSILKGGIILNKALLKSKMCLFGDTQQSLADALSLSSGRLNAKINEYQGASFTQDEIFAIISRYNLTPEETMDIFFSSK